MRKSQRKVSASSEPSEDAPEEVGHEEKYKTVVSSGHSALRALLTMNGGAIILSLTFLDHVWKEKIPAQTMGIFVIALSWYIGGIFAALLSYGSIFVTNCFSSVKWRKSSNAAFVVTIICGLSSLGAFVSGSWNAIGAFRSVIASLPRVVP